MMRSPVTAFYAALLGFVYLWLSIRVARARVAHKVSLGDGGHVDLLVAQRGHGNFSENVPLALVLLAFAESWSQHPVWLIHTLGLALVIARVLHPLGLAPEFAVRAPRGIGFTLTLLVIVVASGLSFWSGLRQFG